MQKVVKSVNIGIDKINFFTPNLYLDLVKLAEARDVEPAKFTIGIGQNKMSLNPITQDTISMAANAALPLVSAADAALIDLVILGTESGLDFSKAGAVTIHRLLGIQPFARALEIKQACYGAVAGLMMARDYVSSHPDRKVLVLGSDVARYGLKTAGEVTQGAGAVAMVVSADPSILILDDVSVPLTADIFDFWRPNYSDTAFVDGKFSNEAYISFFQQTWAEYQRRTAATLEDFTAFCFHLPYSKMGKKALQTVLDTASSETQARLLQHYETSITYTKEIGNIYTGSIFLGLCALLDQTPELQAGDKIGFFSYGSGAVGEFFTGRLAPNYQHALTPSREQNLLETRHELSMTEYERTYNEAVPSDGAQHSFHHPFDNAPIQLRMIDQHQRQYTSPKKEQTHE